MKQLKHIIKISFVCAILAVTIVTTIPAVYGQSAETIDDYSLLTPLPTGKNTDTATATDLSNPVEYVKTLFRIGISLAVVIAVFMIVLGGFETMSTDNIYVRSKGKEKVKHALLGLLLVSISWLILYAINPNLVNLEKFFTNPKPEMQDASTIPYCFNHTGANNVVFRHCEPTLDSCNTAKTNIISQGETTQAQGCTQVPGASIGTTKISGGTPNQKVYQYCFKHTQANNKVSPDICRLTMEKCIETRNNIISQDYKATFCAAKEIVPVREEEEGMSCLGNADCYGGQSCYAGICKPTNYGAVE